MFKQENFSKVVYLSLTSLSPAITSSLVMFVYILLPCKAVHVSRASNSSPSTTLLTTNGVAVVLMLSSESLFTVGRICSRVCWLCPSGVWFSWGISTCSKYFRKRKIIFIYPKNQISMSIKSILIKNLINSLKVKYRVIRTSNTAYSKNFTSTQCRFKAEQFSSKFLKTF